MTLKVDRPKAKKPEGVHEKVRESRFFLEQVAEYELAQDTQKFLFCLSAFLNAFRTITFRLYGVTEHKHDKATAQQVLRQLNDHPEIGFLIRQRDVEVHEDGALVYERFTLCHADPVPQFTDKYTNRFASRFGTRTGQGVVIRHVGGWQFAGNPKNLLELGRDAINAIEVIIRQVLA